jgi:hypothetical protein
MKKQIFTLSHLKKVSLACVLLSSFYVAQALTISPARLEFSADPGSSVTGEFTIVNEQDADQTYYTSVENFEAQGESGTPNFTTNKEGLPSWVQVIDKVEIKKGEKIKIPFTVAVPAGADAGGHFAAIFLSTIPPSTGAGEVSVGAKVGMLMLLKVKGDIKEEGGIMSFSLKNGGRVVTSLPVDFVYRFNNDGNDRVKPTGTTTIKNMIGMTTEKLNANLTEGNVLPHSIRRFEMTWGKNEAIPVSASFMDHVSYQMDNFALGLYFANLDVSFGTKNANKSLFFFVFPWQLLVIILFILFVVILVLRFALHKYNKFIIAQARMMNAESGAKSKKKSDSTKK